MNKNWIITLSWLALTLLLASNSAEASVYKVHPSDDTYIDFMGLNNGGVSFLHIYSNRSKSQAYLKFDIRGIPPEEKVIGAALNVYASGGTSSESVILSYIQDDSWTEETLTLTNRPSPEVSPIQLGTKELVTSLSWLQFDLLESENMPFSIDFITEGIITLMLKTSGERNNSLFLASKEYMYPDKFPHLSITTSPADSLSVAVPLPSSVFLLFSGLAVVLRSRRASNSSIGRENI